MDLLSDLLDFDQSQSSVAKREPIQKKEVEVANWQDRQEQSINLRTLSAW